MRIKYLGSLIQILSLVLVVVSAPGATRASATSPDFADPAFAGIWQRTDALVASGAVSRSYYWGPHPNSGAIYEDYAEGANGKRLVQYFDKSRMEINNPQANKSDPFYVTNGLLAEELISGRMQVGNDKFVDRGPAAINLASDPDDPIAPTYASLTSATQTDGARHGDLVDLSITRLGLITKDSSYDHYSVKYVYYEETTGHNIPDVFWDFLNESGPIIEDGKQLNAPLSAPYSYATGYPITDAYWASVKINGVSNVAVLIQAYQRRILTYVPDAPAGFKVQMGNVGQHYYAWRYNNISPPAAPTMAGHNCFISPPVGSFGKLWRENLTVQQQLDCPYYNTEIPLNFGQQSFEHGQMIDLMPSGDNWPNETIEVLFDDGTMSRFNEDDVIGGSESPDRPPAGLYAPEGSFVKIWGNAVNGVRARLGWATGRETTASIDGPRGSGAIQLFIKGFMVYAGPDLRKIYVLYGGDRGPGLNGYKDPNRWSVYDDSQYRF